MRKIIYFIGKNYLFILSAIILIGLAIFIFYPKIELLFMKKISNDSITSYYPRSWEQINTEELTQKYQPNIKFGIKKSKTENTIFLVRVDSQTGKKNLDTTGSITELKEIYTKKLTDFKLNYIKEITFQNLPAIETEYEYSTIADFKSQEKKFSHQKQIITLKNEKLYWLMFGSSLQDFDRDVKDFDKILKTLKIN
jgi:hypothetical protein